MRGNLIRSSDQFEKFVGVEQWSHDIIHTVEFLHRQNNFTSSVTTKKNPFDGKKAIGN